MKKLDRELGLLSVCAIACGAMLSGLFVLPGHATSIGGPAAYLAFLLAGLLFLPPALSKAEMATAIPEAGGDYIFIDRALGPLFSTVTGLGTWLSLILKSAFALAGLSSYLVLVLPVSVELASTVSVAIGALLTFVNCVGVKKTGQLQTILVFISLVVLVLFVERGIIELNATHYEPLFSTGLGGFLAATAFVFVSYAGVTKIASAAEEIMDPGRNIPWGILISLGLMTFLYTAVANVVIGLVPPENLGKYAPVLYQDAPLAQAALALMGRWGEIVMSVVAILALASMTNAGLLASSRYPFAMARYGQLPSFFSSINERFKTPLFSTLLTGGTLLLAVIFLPVVELAKLASAFLLIVFALVNLSVIVFRESDIEWYQPEFKSPFYPYLQGLGILSSVLLIPFMGLVTILASVGLIGFGIAWYWFYVGDHVDREGTIFQPTARSQELKTYGKVKRRFPRTRETVLVPFLGLERDDLGPVERKLRLAMALGGEDSRIEVLHIHEIPDQTLLSDYQVDDRIEDMLKDRLDLLREQFGGEMIHDDLITHGARGYLVNWIQDHTPQWTLLDWERPSPWQGLVGIKQWWLEDLPTDVVFIKDHEVVDFESVGVLLEPGPFDAAVVHAAERIATNSSGEITFLFPDSQDASDEESYARSYLTELESMTRSESHQKILDPDNFESELIEFSAYLDLLVTGEFNEDAFRGQLQRSFDYERLEDEILCSLARIQTNLDLGEGVLPSEGSIEHTLAIESFLNDRLIGLNESAETKDQLMRILARMLAEESGLPDDSIVNALLRREAVQDTYVGESIAFPHAVIEGLDRTYLGIVQLEEPVEYTRQGDLVQSAIAVLGPPEEREVQLKIIATLAEFLADEDRRNAWINAADTREVHAAFSS